MPRSLPNIQNSQMAFDAVGETSPQIEGATRVSNMLEGMAVANHLRQQEASAGAPDLAEQERRADRLADAAGFTLGRASHEAGIGTPQ